MTLEPYPSPEEREARLARAAVQAGAELIEIGNSVEGRPIVAARIPAAVAGSPKLLLCANIHGPELIGSFAALALLESEALLAPLSAKAELWVVPSLNPDGYARTWGRDGRGALAELRTNAHGVDLNRNFPRPKESRSPIAFAGSSRPGTPFYRGTAPLSEPETAALDRLLAEQRFSASASLHSTMGTLIPPKVETSVDAAGYRRLCGAFRGGQKRVRYFQLSWSWADVYTGELEDHQHHAHRCWSICVEHYPVWASYRAHPFAPSLFWRFNPKDPHRWAENDLPGLQAYFLEALAMPRPGSDSRSGTGTPETSSGDR